MAEKLGGLILDSIAIKLADAMILLRPIISIVVLVIMDRRSTMNFHSL
jgi:hypothetical protein